MVARQHIKSRVTPQSIGVGVRASDHKRAAAGSIMRLSAETHQSYKRSGCRGRKDWSCEIKNITRDLGVVPGDGPGVAMGSKRRLSAVALRATNKDIANQDGSPRHQD